MAIIQSGSSTSLWAIDSTSNAGRITLYDVNGNPMSDVSSLSNILNALNANVTITLAGQSSVGFDIEGTTGTLALSFEATINNINWFAVNVTPTTGGSTITSTSANGQWIVSVGGYYAIRARISSFTSGSMTVSVVITPGLNLLTTVNISGVITSNQGSPNTLANGWPVEVTDGTNILGTSSHPIKIDPTGSTIQPVSGTVTANAGTGTFAVSGTVAATQSGTWTIQPGNTANTTPWLATINQGGNSATVTVSNALKIDGSAVTQPVSGTVTANAGTGNFIVVQATASNLNATVTGAVTSNIGTTNGLALDTSVNGLLVVQGSTTSGEKGTLTLAAVTTGSPSYTTTQTSPLSLTLAGALRTDSSATTQPISGTITANAGTGTFTVSGTVAATQSGTWTIQPGNIANTTPWLSTINQGGNSATVTASNALKIDGSAVTQPISGTVTANAGTGTFAVSGTVTSNIGTTNGLALDTSINGLLLSQGSTTSGEKGPLIQGAVTTSSPSYTTTQTSPLSLTLAGALRTDSSATTQPISGTITANAGTGNFIVTQTTAANLNATIIGTTAAGSGASFGLFTIQGNASGTPVPISGVIAATQSGTWTVQPGNTANTTPWLSTINQGGNSATVTGSNALKVDGSAVTQPISGTITANAGTGNFTVVQATASNLNATITGTVTSNQGTANTLANAWSAKITDTTNGPVAVKAASTAAVATDPALVVAISPNNIIPVSLSDSDATATGTLGALNAAVQITMAGYQSTGMQLAAGTLVGTILPEISFDGGTTWNQTFFDSPNTNIIVSSITFGSSNTASAQSIVGVGGAGLIRVRVSAYTSGTANITLRASVISDPSLLTSGPAGTSIPPVTLQAGGSDGTNLRTFLTDTSGRQVVNQGTAGTLASAWPYELTDGTNGPVAVKTASTQAVYTDSALVVSLNPASAQTRASTSNVTSVVSSASSVTILAANSSRLGAIITNNSTQILYIRYGSSAAAISSGNYTVAVAITNGVHEVYGGYTGTITGIWTSAQGYANISELSV